MRRSLFLPELGDLKKRIDERFPKDRAAVRSEVQASRLYGHTLTDLLALSLISGLDRAENPAKFDAVAALLKAQPEAVKLRIERGGNPAREGMFSVVQPQLVVEIRRETR